MMPKRGGNCRTPLHEDRLDMEAQRLFERATGSLWFLQTFEVREHYRQIINESRYEIVP